MRAIGKVQFPATATPDWRGSSAMSGSDGCLVSTSCSKAVQMDLSENNKDCLFRRLYSADHASSALLLPLDLIDECGNETMSPFLAALQGARIHMASKRHDRSKLLPLVSTKASPSLLPRCPHRSASDAHERQGA